MSEHLAFALESSVGAVVTMLALVGWLCACGGMIAHEIMWRAEGRRLPRAALRRHSLTIVGSQQGRDS
jgi:hypothetical protein